MNKVEKLVWAFFFAITCILLSRQITEFVGIWLSDLFLLFLIFYLFIKE